MDVLWAPWRMTYILGNDKYEGCIFCPGEDRSMDAERLMLYVDQTVLVLMNKYPYVNGHLLVAPVRHVPNLDGLEPGEMLAVMEMVRATMGILKSMMHPDGFNVGLNLGRVAGAGVEEHMHFHIVPRWNGDTNYMTVIGEVRVIPEHLQATYEKLLPYFNRLKTPAGGEV
ncbi:HIT family protein [Desulfatiglans anilini]|uniref:HIT family protein n=1 Tax=Desulfatiglans anilini TaxID=90728 RepID=UPI000484BF05|nr:HIT domain-containing protein [Desulfatiglans anilini]